MALLTPAFFCSETNRVWYPETGAWLVWWMKYQIFAPIFLLQILNLFWYYFIWRIALRSVICNSSSRYLMHISQVTETFHHD
jgi:hypothetical protein